MKHYKVVLKQGSVKVKAQGELDAINTAHEKLGLSGDIELVKVLELTETEPTISSDDWDYIIALTVFMTSLVMGIIYGGSVTESIVYTGLTALVSLPLGAVVIMIKDRQPTERR